MFSTKQSDIYYNDDTKEMVVCAVSSISAQRCEDEAIVYGAVPIIYKIAHQLHHRNINTGPWSGISMHPIEHIFYFSIIILWAFVPTDPFVVVLTGIWFGVGPAQSHAGFNKLVLFKTKTLEFADHFHHLHHKHFELNYGNIYAPIDPIFKTFHNGKISPKKK